jgi:hypothetical protein
MNMKTALIGSFAAAAALVAVSADANARSWNYKRTACGPSATVIKHNRYGFVGSERDYGVRSRTYIRCESARFGVRGGHDRIGVNVRERAGANVNVNARFGSHDRSGVNARIGGGQDRSGTRLSGSERNTGAGAGAATGRSVSPSSNSNTSGSGGTASSGAAAKTGTGGGAAGGAGLGAPGGGSSSGGGMGSGGGAGGSR